MHQLWVLQLCAQCVERGPANTATGAFNIIKQALSEAQSEAEASKATGELQNL